MTCLYGDLEISKLLGSNPSRPANFIGPEVGRISNTESAYTEIQHGFPENNALLPGCIVSRTGWRRWGSSPCVTRTVTRIITCPSQYQLDSQPFRKAAPFLHHIQTATEDQYQTYKQTMRMNQRASIFPVPLDDSRTKGHIFTCIQTLRCRSVRQRILISGSCWNLRECSAN